MNKSTIISMIILTSFVSILTSCGVNNSKHKKENIKYDNSILFSSTRNIANGDLYTMTKNGKILKE